MQGIFSTRVTKSSVQSISLFTPLGRSTHPMVILCVGSWYKRYLISSGPVPVTKPVTEDTRVPYPSMDPLHDSHKSEFSRKSAVNIFSAKLQTELCFGTLLLRFLSYASPLWTER